MPTGPAADTHYWGALALTPEEKSGIEDPIEMQRRADALPVERTASPLDQLRRPDEHCERVAEYLDMGFKHLVFHAPGPEQDEFIRRYGSEILPRLRSRS